tara:strand:- start:1544 stop:2206 length:663 start_codon:yes stop_codon:yes gene_type:complete
MDEKIIIEIDGKDYPVLEPTISKWSILNLLKDIEEEDNFVLSIVSISTGIDEDLLRKASFKKVKQSAEFLTHYFLEMGKKFYPEFEFKGKKYKFMDINNMSFGHFVDIDTFTQRDESYKKSNMGELMGMLYMEEGETEYNSNRVMERKELFKDLEVKYLQGAMSFFFHLRKQLQENTPYYLRIKWKMMRVLKRLKPSTPIGVGMGRLYSWVVKTLKTWKK